MVVNDINGRDELKHSMNFQSASDIEKHAEDEIAKFLREVNSSYIKISFMKK